MRFPWAQNPIAQLTTSQYTFIQSITALNESLQFDLEMSLSRTDAQDVVFEQYLNDPRDVSRHSQSTSNRHRWSVPVRSKSPYNRKRTSRSPNNRYRRDLSRSPRRNSNFRKALLCYGCGSPNNKIVECPSVLKQETIKTNLISVHGCPIEDAQTLAEEFMSLKTNPSTQKYGRQAHGLEEDETPRRTEPSPHSVHFQEIIYEAEEQDVLQQRITAAFRSDEFERYFASDPTKHENPVDFSNIFFGDVRTDGDDLGFCADIGAPRSVVGRIQLNRVLANLGRKNIPCIASKTFFRFGDVTVRSQGKIQIAMETPANVRPISVLLDIVPVDVPALLGLDVMDGECIYADNVINRLVHWHMFSRKDEPLRYKDLCHVPLTRYAGHLYVRMGFPRCTFYTITQLKKMHRQFAHRSASKLYNLLKIA